MLGDDGEFVPCLHSVGYPLEPGQADVPWPCDAEHKYIVHFPETREIWSYGSGYGGNALLGKKCFALRIASAMARDDRWLAEHMLILKLTSPEGDVRYVAGAFPSACGKTNLAMLVPTIPGWKVETIGDDICWMKFGDDGRLYAINPEAGFFGVAPGTSTETNPNAMATLHATASSPTPRSPTTATCGGRACRRRRPAHLTDWRGNDWTPGVGDARRPPQRPLHRPRRTEPGVRPGMGGPRGRAHLGHPLRRSAGARRCRSSPSPSTGPTACSSVRSCRRRPRPPRPGRSGNLRRDPFAMLPFCGYNMADYFAHWLHIGKSTDAAKLPRIYYVNWFRKDADGRFLWPGYGENSRVLAWIVERTTGTAEAAATAIGNVPRPGAIDTDGLDVSEGAMAELLAGRRRRVARRGAAHPRALRPLRRPPAGGADRAARRAGAPAGLSAGAPVTAPPRPHALRARTQRWRRARRLVRYDSPVTAATAAMTTSPEPQGQGHHHRQQGPEHPHELQPGLEAGEGPALGGGGDVALDQASKAGLLAALAKPITKARSAWIRCRPTKAARAPASATDQIDRASIWGSVSTLRTRGTSMTPTSAPATSPPA